MKDSTTKEAIEDPALDRTCPSCHATTMELIYSVDGVPANSVLLLHDLDEARHFRTGHIRLGYCPECGFISNRAFRAELLEYSARYESTQAYSATYNSFAQRLAEQLVQRHDLHGKDIIEIGCGQGEFLHLLCALGNNRGVGFDPAYNGSYQPDQGAATIEFVADFYSDRYTHVAGDFICCKMTLEHVYQVGDFVETVRKALGDRFDSVVFFQIPNATRVLQDVAFWDIYYEHCSYFTDAALVDLFTRAGFQVTAVYTDYDDQYLMIEAHPAARDQVAPWTETPGIAERRADVHSFVRSFTQKRRQWERLIQETTADGRRAVIWGGGSKAVALLTTMGIDESIRYVVDINPKKEGTYLPVTGQQVVAPDFLTTYRPQTVFVMNPVYCAEIAQELETRGVDARLIPIE